QLPIVALTADAMKGTKEKVLQAGMNDYLSKPLDVGHLYAAVLRWAGANTAAPVFDLANTETQRLLGQLMAQLKELDIHALDTLNQLQPMKHGGKLPIELTRLAAHIKAFDYDKALKLLQQLKN
ncbi:MAG: hypothetical protein WBI20_11920, partial [Burkholderiaceae bacterium]